MSYFADERLPEDYFKGVMEEKAEMLRKYLKDLGDLLNLLHMIIVVHTNVR